MFAVHLLVKKFPVLRGIQTFFTAFIGANQINPMYGLTYFPLKIHFNIITLSGPGFPTLPLSFRFTCQNST